MIRGRSSRSSSHAGVGRASRRRAAAARRRRRSVCACASAASSVDGAAGPQPDVAVRVDQAGEDPALDLRDVGVGGDRPLERQPPTDDPRLTDRLVVVGRDSTRPRRCSTTSLRMRENLRPHRSGRPSPASGPVVTASGRGTSRSRRAGRASAGSISGVAPPAPPSPKAAAGGTGRGRPGGCVAFLLGTLGRVARLGLALARRARSCRATSCRRHPCHRASPACRACRPSASIWRIIFRASKNRSTSWLTSVTVHARARWRCAAGATPLMIFGVARSCGRHRPDDRLDAVELALVDVVQRVVHLAHAGQHAEQVPDRAHLADAQHLLEEVLEREVLAGADLGRPSPRPASASKAFSACSIRVSTSPMSRMREAIRSGWKTSKSSSFSPVEANRIGTPVTSTHRQRRTAAGVAVELGQHDAGEADAVAERLGGGRPRPGRSSRRGRTGSRRADGVADVGGLAPSARRRRRAGRRCRR